MPIKLPKGFTRRKSSGNVLDEVDQPTESSFRVFERPDGVNKVKTFGGNGSENRFYRPATADSDNIFAGIEKPLPNNRGSGGTNNSASTTGLYDSASSARYSSSSTLPSSTDVPLHNDHLTRGIHDLPIPPVPESSSLFSLRAAGRTFSFGTRPQRASTPLSQQQQQHQPSSSSSFTARDRAMTASSASTAIPPKLLDSDLNISGSGEDNFSNMFENFGKRKSAILLDSSKSGDMKPKNSPAPVSTERGAQLAPIIIDRQQPVEPSPYSWDSQTSSNSLIHKKDESNTPTARTTILSPSHSYSVAQSRSPMPPASENSFAADDDDAEIVRQSTLLSDRNLPPASTSPHPNTDEETPLFESDDIISSVQLASQYEQRVASAPTVPNKVMTPAQFEHYRKQRELRRQLSNASKSDNSEAENDYEDDEDDEDETEKSREVARQRRKQEAHLSIYRQQMMKVIGQDNPNPTSDSPSLRPISERGSMSTPNLLARTSMLGLPSGKQGSGKSSDAEDDEDVPLGILAAHGFPNKNRPPTRLNMSNSNPNLRVSYSASPGPGSNGQGSEARNSLPVFARNLPRDPYYGASIVNAPNRESLAMGGGTPAFANSPSSTSLPPGGLVGVIANEERARAMRRGSPNAQAAGIPRPYSVANMGQITPGEQAQIQLSQQMTEMMQVQVQMMQHMMQMQGISGGQLPQMNQMNLMNQMNSNFLSAPGQPAVMTGGRPLSTASSLHLSPNPPPQVDQRTLSMLDPNLSRWNLNRPASVHPEMGGRPMTPQGHQGYAPSIAPSERSNVGMASRYRPVSMAGQDPQTARSSTFTSALKPWNENQRPNSVVPSHPQPSDRKSTSLATVTVRSVSAPSRETLTGKQNSKGAVSDDDDDEGWADMMKSREKKKSSWKLKKETSALGDLLHMVH